MPKKFLLNFPQDGHNDMNDAGSVGNDFQGFTMFIGDRGSFPLTSIGGIKITPGLSVIKLLRP
jgi:hypothetical protein